MKKKHCKSTQSNRFVDMMIMLLLVSMVGSTSTILMEGFSPTYCIDPFIKEIVGKRASKCFFGGSALSELAYLRNLSASDYQRSHELLAYQYFINDTSNIHRRSCADADFEYIPMLPISWRSGYPTSTRCTAGGFCPQTEVIGDANCSLKNLITDILSIVSHIKTSRDENMNEGIPKFTVASTYNLKTVMAFGLESAKRSGPVYSAVTSFVTSLSIGHYERQPQCTDVLRKSWKQIVEIPFVSLLEESIGRGTRLLNRNAEHSQKNEEYSSSLSLSVSESEGEGANRTTTFYFGGRLLLWLPERVCSIRHVIATALPSRTDTVVLNISESQAYGPVRGEALGYLFRSVFCLVARTDSYSSASFYDALHAGCIPIVISDWYVFAFPSEIRYEEFVIRVEEEDFVKNPHTVLDQIKTLYPKILQNKMRDRMTYWLQYLSYGTRRIANRGNTEMETSYRRTEQILKMLAVSGSESDGTTVKTFDYETVVPFEMMLREMKFHNQQVKKKSEKEILKFNKTIATPLKSRTAITDNIMKIKGKDKDEDKEEDTSDRHCYSPHSCTTRVRSMTFPSLNETRTHMCVHKHRFMGRYKMVFFMQCVRIIWPIAPGKMKPGDLVPNALNLDQQIFIKMFHNVSKNTTTEWYSSWVTYPPSTNGQTGTVLTLST